MRHYHKKPLEYNIPCFNPVVPLHEEIARKSAEMKHQIDKFVQENTLNEIALHPRRVQNAILKRFKRDFEELDALILQLLSQK